jgi:hypothetical protein
LAEVYLFAPFFLFYQGWLKKLLHACITNQARKYYTTGILHNTDEFHRYLNINSIKKNINEIMNKKFLFVLYIDYSLNSIITDEFTNEKHTPNKKIPSIYNYAGKFINNYCILLTK